MFIYHQRQGLLVVNRVADQLFNHGDGERVKDQAIRLHGID